MEIPNDKLYYSIGEVAKKYNVNTSLIRFWEKEFDELKPKKNKKGNRLFSKKDLETIDIIYHLLKEKGFTIEGAKTYLKSNKTKIKDNLEIQRSLEKIKAFLLELKDEL
jgi:DNA-binding transcriptional MerR regulator